MMGMMIWIWDLMNLSDQSRERDGPGYSGWDNFAVSEGFGIALVFGRIATAFGWDYWSVMITYGTGT